MADAVTSTIVYQDANEILVHLTNISDGSGEAAAIKVDKSAITVATDLAEAGSLDLLSVEGWIQGFTGVRLLWDHTTDDVAALLIPGAIFRDYTATGALLNVQDGPGRADPRSAGGTGDLLLTTVGAASAATYDLYVLLRKNPD